LPPGILLTQDGILRGTPPVAGTYTFTVQLTDSSTPAKTTSATFTLNVN
jgi:Putative Ig domain